jgi:hypothetical protein
VRVVFGCVCLFLGVSGCACLASVTGMCGVTVARSSGLDRKARLSHPTLTSTPHHTTPHYTTPHTTGNKPLMSPATNVEFREEQAILAPNVFVRGLVLEYTATKTREWAAAEQRWREWVDAEEQEGAH